MNLDFEEEKKDPFIPYKGWEGYNQSDYLKEWSQTTIKEVKRRTGIEFPEGTKGFPFELFKYIWRDFPEYISDLFTTRVSNKAFIAAKNTLKTGMQITHSIFMMVNFDKVEEVFFMKYQNQLWQILEGFKGYMDIIYKTCGIEFHSLFDLPEKLNANAENIKFERVWNKGKGKDKKGRVIRSVFLRSFDKPNKIANTPPPANGGWIATARIVEPVMFNDPGDVSASQMAETWRVNKSSLFRFAYKENKFSQMITDMNNWNQNHDFVIIANEILPYDLDYLIENKTQVTIDEERNWLIRRITRFANKIIPYNEGTDEYREYEPLKETNPNLYYALVYGGPYEDNENNFYTYANSISENNDWFIDDLTVDFLKNKEFEMYFGMDYGSNHATTLKCSVWLPEEGILIRDAVWRNCNMERKKDKLLPLKSLDQLNSSFIGLVEFITPFIEKLGMDKFILLFDHGSKSMMEALEQIIESYGLEKWIHVIPTQKHGTRKVIKHKVEWDNKMHAMGIVKYTHRNKITFDQYNQVRNKKSDPEERDEKNQLLDEVDATNIAEEYLRFEIDHYLFERRNIMSRKENNV